MGYHKDPISKYESRINSYKVNAISMTNKEYTDALDEFMIKFISRRSYYYVQKNWGYKHNSERNIWEL